jgi:nucleoside-diphosphate-sugar epimerase
VRVLILGGTALTGPFIVQQLHELGHEVLIFHRGNTEAALPTDVRHIHGERAQLGDFATELRSFSPDVVLDMIATNDRDCRRVMDLFRGVAGRIVAISSADVYRAYDIVWGRDTGQPQPTPLDEDAELRSSRYPDGGERDKILAEQAVMSDPELPGTILRYPMVYGSNDGGRIATELRRMDDGRPAILLEETFAQWRWCRGYAENVAHATVLAVTNEQAANRIYNVAEPDALTMQHWIEALGRAADWHGRIVPLPADQLPSHLVSPLNFRQDWTVDTQRIRTELGYREPIDRDEALRRTVAWWREAPVEAMRLGALPTAEEYQAEDAVIGRLSL